MQFDSRGGGRGDFSSRDGERQRFEDRVVRINRVSKVVRGGRRFGFNAIVVVGDRDGRVGVSMGRAREVADAIQKGQERAKRTMITVPLDENGSIPHYVEARFGASKVILRPAGPGTGVIAGGAVRAVLELAGVRNVLTKIIGSSNAVNVVRATLAGLESLSDPASRRLARLKLIESSSAE